MSGPAGGAPHGPATGLLLGVLDVTGPLETISADTLRMVRCAVRVAEALVGNARRRNDLGWLMCPECVLAVGPSADCRGGVSGAPGDKPAAVCCDGSRVALTLRRAEILALLDSRAQDWTAEELAYELYGDAGTTAAPQPRCRAGEVATGRLYRLHPKLGGRERPQRRGPHRDVHRNWANDLKVNYKDPASPVVGSELVCASITSTGNGTGSTTDPTMAWNRHLKF